jgi:hypothetical protein
MALGRIVLTGVALCLAVSTGAFARVGVTSATNGDPLGRPPNEAERILRIGVDVQANELITTQSNDRAHLLFLDGTSLTVGPNARITIDKYVYDPNSKTGELSMTATNGVFRLVGGKISKKTPVTINTPSSTIGVRGGISIFTVTDKQTTTTFIFGTSMTVTGQGQTQTATRPNSTINTNTGSAPGQPTQVTQGSLTGTLTTLEGGSGSGGTGGTTGGTTAGGTTGGTTTTYSSSNVDASSTQLSSVNSNDTSTSSGTTTTGGTTGGTSTSGSTTQTNNAVTNAVSNSQTQQQTQETTQTTTPKTTKTFNAGYVGGIVGTSAPGAPTTARVLNPVGQPPAPGDVSLSTNATSSTAQATIIVRGYQPGGGLGFPPAVFQMGGPGASTFTDDLTYSMTPSTDPSRQSQVGGGTLKPGFQLSSGSPGVAGCECAFLSWGNWSGSVEFPNTPGAFRQGQTDNILGAYVVGTLTNVALPQTGTATYSGVAFGSFADTTGASPRAGYAAGGFTQSWNFQSQTGFATISNFDGATYTSNTALQNGTVNFTGPLSGAGRTGQINGSFFGNNAPFTAPPGQAGNFSVTNGTGSYKAGGIFAGQKSP